MVLGMVLYTYTFHNHRNMAPKPKYRKITVNLPVELLEAALSVGERNLTETIRTGLELIAAKNSYKGLHEMRGKVTFKSSIDELRRDR